MYTAMKITENLLDVLDVLDPTFVEQSPEALVGHYLVINRHNKVVMIVHERHFDEWFETIDVIETVDLIKVRKR